MFNFKYILKNNKVSVHSIAFFSIFAFYIWMTINSLLTFKQFDFYSILSVSLVFLLILFLLLRLFLKDIFIQKLEINSINLFFASFVLMIMLIIVSEPNPSFLYYVRTFPLLEAEVGLGWHQDTAFHTSIIQSILNFGYPSISQHGSPIIVYHVLSHYIDASIIYLTGVEVFDSYGLLFNFKITLFIISTIIFLSRIVSNRSVGVFLLLAVLIAPAILGTWHAVGSHGLWFTSILLLLSSIKVFNILVKVKYNSLLDFIFLLVLIILISLGKISTGFMYAAFIGFFLLYKQPKDIKVYLLGSAWIVFFYIYQKLLVPVDNNITALEFNISSVFNFLTQSTHYSHVLVSIYSSIIILFILTIILRTKENKNILSAALLSFLVLVFLVSIKELSLPDIFYFKYGLSSVLILFTLQMLYLNQKDFFIKFTSYHKIIQGTILILGVLFSSLYYKQSLDMVNFGIVEKEKKKNRKIVSFDTLNKKDNRRLYLFRDKLNDFLAKNNIDKNEAILFISKEIFENEVAQFKGPPWARGMFMYAVTGVPLIYGLKENHKGYGYSDYDQNSYWKNSGEFEKNEVCKLGLSKSIIIADGIEVAHFSINKCE